jgi:hypothetical protein
MLYVMKREKRKDFQKTLSEMRDLEGEILTILRKFSAGISIQAMDAAIEGLQKNIMSLQTSISNVHSLEEETNQLQKQAESLQSMQSSMNLQKTELLAKYSLSGKYYEEIFNKRVEREKLQANLKELEAEAARLKNTMENGVVDDEIETNARKLKELKNESTVIKDGIEKNSNVMDKISYSFENILSLHMKRDDLMRSLSNFRTILENCKDVQSTIEKKKNSFISNYSKPFQEEFSHIAQNIIGRTVPVLIDDDLTIKFNIKGKAVNVEDVLSKATMDQLVLAYKIALSHVLKEEQLPLIIDNSLIRYDDERLGNSMKLLLGESQRRQIIILTSDRRITSKVKEFMNLEAV